MTECPHCNRPLPTTDSGDAAAATTHCPDCGSPLTSSDTGDGELELAEPVERPAEAFLHATAALEQARAKVANQEDKPEPPRSPFRQGVWRFPFYFDTIGRWFGFTVIAWICTWLLLLSVLNAQGGGAASAFGVIMLALFCVIGSLWFITLAATLMAILDQTACGNDRLLAWPDYQITDQLGDAVTLAVALAIAATPGWIVLDLFVESRPLCFAAAVLSGTILFPVILLSMLEGGSAATLFSRKLGRTIKRHPDIWCRFYGHYAAAVIGTAILFGFLASWSLFVALAMAVAGTLIAFRLLGRLAQLLEQATLAEDAEEDDA